MGRWRMRNKCHMMTHREISIRCETREEARRTKQALRAGGQHAWIESTDNESWPSRGTTAKIVIVADHHPEIGPIEPAIARIIN